MNKIYRILGKRGRVTIPYYLRILMEYKANDVVSFRVEGDEIIVKREKICDGCKKTDASPVEKPTDEITLLDFLDGLSVAEQRAALVHLSVKWAQLQAGGKNA